MIKPLLSPNALFSDHLGFLLQRCLKCKALQPGKQVHAMLLASRIDMNILSMSSKLVGMYASCGDLQSARLVLERTQNPNVFAFNWMVSALAFHGYHEEAIGYFSLMQELGIVANKFTFSIVLKQCVGLMDFNKGREVHCVISRTGFGNVVSVANSLIDMYCKCGHVGCGRKVFDGMIERDVVSWTSMICGYCNIGTLEEALVLFERMKVEGLEPNDFTWNAMIAGYARDGDCNGAFVLFSRMVREGLVPDLVTWNAMISGFTQSLKAVEAWRLFQDMLVAGIKPNQVTVTGLLPACGLMGSIHRGKELHGLIYRMGFDMNVFVATALIDVYSKCGTVKDAWDVFDRIPIKNVASWNAMIGCYGKHGLVDSSIQLFERMQAEGMQANHITLISVLSACSHGGLVEKGLTIFRSMKEKYGVEISQEHYSCVLDLLCRSGRMVEAYELFKEMPIEVTDSIVGAFFNGCKIHGRRDLAKLMAEDILRMELKRPGGFVTLSNIYAADGEWEEVENIRKVMKEQGVHKKPGFSWVEKRDGFVESETRNEYKIAETGIGMPS
ncbi:pentatricopeptide repeat-containing protein At5g59600-like [Vitis riparia]|uniref:pentatricopeptide repeat-containing protein At5g59600-like n=1 Tax=Vitis riparia TaxID=96939 RepID=UPI00155B27F4|nr:pentatricopeptide repeat-containing protein At5g59600-like [Vitis riparia]